MEVTDDDDDDHNDHDDGDDHKHHDGIDNGTLDRIFPPNFRLFSSKHVESDEFNDKFTSLSHVVWSKLCGLHRRKTDYDHLLEQLLSNQTDFLQSIIAKKSNICFIFVNIIKYQSFYCTWFQDVVSKLIKSHQPDQVL